MSHDLFNLFLFDSNNLFQICTPKDGPIKGMHRRMHVTPQTMRVIIQKGDTTK